MPEPKDMIIPLLQDMRDEMRAGFAQVDKRFKAVESRLAKIEATQTSFRHALVADGLLARLVTGDPEERIAALEENYSALLGRQS